MKLLNTKEARELGIIHELNRQFLHPLGLALFVIEDDEGNVSIGDIIDGREDQDGYIFTKLDKEKMKTFSKLWTQRTEARQKRIGFTVQEEDYTLPQD